MGEEKPADDFEPRTGERKVGVADTMSVSAVPAPPSKSTL
jgi:hypothetical protein